MADRGLQLPLFSQYIENVRVPVTSSLVLYSDWFKQTEIYRKLEQAFHYLEVKEKVEVRANQILNGYGKSRLLPTLTTGVQGDYRTYKFVLMIEVPPNIDYKLLGQLSTRLTNEISEVNRMVLLTAGLGISENEILFDDYFLKE